jgi:hypothetical protein
MHLPKPNLFGYLLAGVIGLLFIVAAVLGMFGGLMTNVIAGFAGGVAVLSTVMTVKDYVKKAKEENNQQK